MDLYMKRIKNKLQQAIESGVLNEQQKRAAIDDTLDSLLIYYKEDTKVNKVIQDFQDKNETLFKELMEKDEKISNNYTNIYNHIIQDDF